MSTERRVRVDAKTGYDLWVPIYDFTPNLIGTGDDLVLGELSGDMVHLPLPERYRGMAMRAATALASAQPGLATSLR